ncbi:hypothetical protein SAMN05444372_1239 [Flavobacterium micromati]|uniref:Uncharacterized protein n=1 Tax=Flavobacterium micromati TaxID=229205 RepID=A0A1M5R2Z7_9FLAO|nr:hypothetical protein SAMN05444372_1239 [Flavobacterium micromati]
MTIVQVQHLNYLINIIYLFYSKSDFINGVSKITYNMNRYKGLK